MITRMNSGGLGVARLLFSYILGDPRQTSPALALLSLVCMFVQKHWLTLTQTHWFKLARPKTDGCMHACGDICVLRRIWVHACSYCMV